ncbi:MAG: aldehyde ferredoxin oxidoreductase family protein [Deltaproteobacteria bacterium]|jgi:aldehyde:ferredoxin oxidoreductase|nr:aldehyde ferredoxin oxidoreductase family protein [Deltaproteobacteria bacterium]
MSVFGQILDIDLTAETWKLSDYPQILSREYLGGRGLNVRLLYDHILPGTDPLGPQNILALSCGMLTGTAAPASSRLHINALSPLTGILGSSNIGGAFGVSLRRCNIQQLIIRGRASRPVYLWIDGDAIEIRNAKSLWGKDTWETEKLLKYRLGSEKLKILAIGPAGEKECRFGCIITDRHHAAGRTGMGSVMGSKNLKAIVVKAPKSPVAFRPKNDTHEAIKRYLWQIKSSPEFKNMKAHGGAGYVDWADELGILATRNYRDYHFEDTNRIDGKLLQENITRKRGCPRCPVQCKAHLRFSTGRLKGKQAVRPEFEPMLALGARCGLNDLQTLVHLDNLCTRLGMDSISAGTVIAFAMDLFDRCIINKSDTGGLELSWGNGAAMEKLIRQMAAGRGFGRILAQGVRKASQIIGRGAENYAAHIKGLEMAGYHPYNMMGTALGYSVSSRGADFSDIYATLEYKWLPEKATKVFGTPVSSDPRSIQGKAELVRRSMIVGSVLDCLGLCKVPALCLICTYDLVGEAELVSALSGRTVSVTELFLAGERIVNLERLFNQQHGAGISNDQLPAMFFEKEYNAGIEPSKPAEWMEPMKQEFYDIMGWDDAGHPTAEKLAELGLSGLPFAAQPAA